RCPCRVAMIASVPVPRSSMVTPGVPTGLPQRNGVNTSLNGEMNKAPPSATQLLPCRIIENWIAYFDPYVCRSHRVVVADQLAVTRGPPGQETQADPMAERRGKCH